MRFAAVAFLCAVSCAAQVRGPQVLTYRSDVDGTDQPYALYLPNAFDPARKYPLVVSLHGEGSNHRLNLRRVFGRGNLAPETDAEAGRWFPPLPGVDFIVVCPFARGSLGYEGIGEKDVYDVMDDARRRFPIDEDRVYLTGLSMGGGGTLRLGFTRPDLWAAIAPVSPTVPPGLEDLAGNALDFPVHLFHGDQDPAVPVALSRAWQKRLIDLGVSTEYAEYPGVRHNAWDYAYRNAGIFGWFANFRRNRFPPRVRFASRFYRYDRAYWVTMDQFTPGTLAAIDATFTAPNRLDITTRSLDAFTLRLDGHSSFTAGAPVSVRVDGAVVRVKPAAVLGFHRTAKGWQPGRQEPPAGNKRPGSEGPAGEAVAARHIYVYGTADAPPEDERKRRRQVAAHAAEWSSPRVRLQVSFAVKADRDVTSQDLAGANLILFGNRRTNSLIARWADRLPMALDAGAADYGLVFITSIEGRYVLVNSGLPWWTGAGDAARPGVSRDSPPFRVLQSFPDYVLFKGSLENVFAEGQFGRDWRLPAAAAGKLRAAGPVSIP